MLNLTKVCRRCKMVKPITEFYVRSGITTPEHEGHYNSECKDCVKDRSRTVGSIHPTVPRQLSEQLGLAELLRQGISSLPGKAVFGSHVDIVCWGCVLVEIKYSRLESHAGQYSFRFSSTPRQVQRGFLAHVVMLICDYDSHQTYHLFKSNYEAFYINGHLKTSFFFTPGQSEQLKHQDTRLKLLQPAMDESENRFELIEEYRVRISEALRRGDNPNQI